MLLQVARQVVPDRSGGVGGVEQEDAARGGLVQHVVAVQEDGLMAGDEAGLVIAHQIGAGRSGLGAEAQVGDGDRAGLLGVVLEVALAEVGRLLAR